MTAGRRLGILALAGGLVAPALPAQQTLAERQRAAAAEKAGWRAALSAREIEAMNGGDMHSVHFFTRHSGWAVGRGVATMVFRTNDGGRTWERQPIMDGASHGSIFNAIRFWDANHGWITGRHGLLRTSDGGESWEPVKDAGFHDGRVLLPLSPNVVMLGTSDGGIWRTDEGGSAALQVGRIGESGASYVTGLAFVAPRTFFATTASTYQTSGAIHRSTDGGATWEPVVEGDRQIRGIAFHDDSRGVAVGEGVAYWTADGGDSWKRVLAAGSRLAVSFVDENTVVSVGAKPAVLVSRTGGRTWQAFPGPAAEFSLNDVQVVDAGWWFVATRGHRERGVHHYVDPAFVDAIATARVPIAGTIALPDGRRLPRGLYDVVLAHQGDRHQLTLTRAGDAPPDSAAGPPPGTTRSGSGSGASAGDGAAPACDPCTATVPVDVEYEVEEITEKSSARPRLRFSLEPTATGVAIVIDAAVTPPRDAALALAALGASTTTEADAVTTVQRAGDAKKKAGGWADRLRKAADGDLRGAAAGANPKAATERLKSAKASPPGVYRIKVRYPIEVFRATAAAPGGAP